MLAQYKFPVRSDIIREIKKRGAYIQRQDANGNVQKKRNENGPTSDFGWGAVEDTLPMLRKDTDQLCKAYPAILAEIPSANDRLVDELFEPSNYIAPALEPVPLLNEWYNHWAQQFHAGNRQVVPPCYQQADTLPSLQSILESAQGQAMLHFCTYLKQRL